MTLPSAGCPLPFLTGSNVKLGILEGSAADYSQRFVVVIPQDPGEKDIPPADLKLFPKDHSRISPFGDGTYRCSKIGGYLTRPAIPMS